MVRIPIHSQPGGDSRSHPVRRLHKLREADVPQDRQSGGGVVVPPLHGVPHRHVHLVLRVGRGGKCLALT